MKYQSTFNFKCLMTEIVNFLKISFYQLCLFLWDLFNSMDQVCIVCYCCYYSDIYSLYDLYTNLMSNAKLAKKFFCVLVSCLNRMVICFTIQNLFNSMESHFLIRGLNACTTKVIGRNFFAVLINWNLFPSFSSFEVRA